MIQETNLRDGDQFPITLQDERITLPWMSQDLVQLNVDKTVHVESASLQSLMVLTNDLRAIDAWSQTVLHRYPDEALGESDERRTNLIGEVRRINGLLEGMKLVTLLNQVRENQSIISDVRLAALTEYASIVGNFLGYDSRSLPDENTTEVWIARRKNERVVFGRAQIPKNGSAVLLEGIKAAHADPPEFTEVIPLDHFSVLVNRRLLDVSRETVEAAGGFPAALDSYASIHIQNRRQVRMLHLRYPTIRHDAAKPIGNAFTGAEMLVDYPEETAAVLPVLINGLKETQPVLKEMREAACDTAEVVSGQRFQQSLARLNVLKDMAGVTVHLPAEARLFLHNDVKGSRVYVPLDKLSMRFSPEYLDICIDNIMLNAKKAFRKRDEEQPGREGHNRSLVVSCFIDLRGHKPILRVWFDDNATGVPEKMAEERRFSEGETDWGDTSITGTGEGMASMATSFEEYGGNLYPMNIVVPDPYDYNRQMPIGARIVGEFVLV